jgi:transposase-like protein
MRKFNGVLKGNFGLFLKECEKHFNNPYSKRQLTQIKQIVAENLKWLSGTAH